MHDATVPIRRRFAVFAVLLAGLASLALFPGLAAADKVNATTFGNVAIDGYDPVAYFTEGRPTEGSADFSYDWDGASWHFASAENRNLFAADPDAYAPQYGGYCAWAVSQGYTASIDPEAWSIVSGKLYLNYSTGIRQRWEQDVAGHITAADRNWPDIRAGL